MIIGPDFVWLHFPKCAGTLVERVLRSTFGGRPALEFDPIDPDEVIWHQSVEERAAATGMDFSDRAVICGFRRLPDWMLSRMHFEKRRSGAPIPPAEMYLHGRFINERGEEDEAESYVRRFTSRPVTHWIRVEHLRRDFVAAFSPYLDVSGPLVQLRLRRRRNRGFYRRGISHWFKAGDLETLYDSCPTWRDIERSLYGDLLTS